MSHAVSTRRNLLALALSGLLALGALSMLASPVRAATFVVDSTADQADATPGDGICASSTGACTLRAAIEEANALAGPDIITVPAGTYVLTLGDLHVEDDVTINGAGAGSTIVDGNATDRVFHLRSPEGSLVGPGATVVTINGLTIRNGAASAAGGLSAVAGTGDVPATVALTGVVVTGNAVTGSGGGILNGSFTTMTITNSTISGNTAAGDGGGILSSGFSTLIMFNSTVSGNSAATGGGIYATGPVGGGASIDLVRTAVSGNTAGTDGGGIWGQNGEVSLDQTTVSGNTAGGQGGGIWIVAPFSSQTTHLSLVNSTVSGNTASTDGGGIRIDGTLQMHFSTVASNQSTTGNGGGIWTQDFATFHATIVANNPTGGDCFHNDTGVDSLGSNLDSDDTCGFDQTTDQPDTDPMLGSLAANGGPTMTHALLAGSPAIDAVEEATPACPATDQRGVTRPQDGDDDGAAVCDIGAFELVPAAQPTAVPTAAPTTAPTTAPTGTAAPTASELPDTTIGDGSVVVTGMAAAMLLLLLISASALRTAAVRGRRR